MPKNAMCARNTHTHTRSYTHINIVMSFRFPLCRLWYFQCGFDSYDRFSSFSIYFHLALAFTLPAALLTKSCLCVRRESCNVMWLEDAIVRYIYTFHSTSHFTAKSRGKRNRENWHDNLRSHRISRKKAMQQH